MEHRHATLARVAWEAVSTSDVETLREVCSEKLIWHASGRGARSASGSASENQKQLPRPGALSTPISPPIASTMRREMARPRPVPPKRRVAD